MLVHYLRRLLGKSHLKDKNHSPVGTTATGMKSGDPLLWRKQWISTRAALLERPGVITLFGNEHFTLGRCRFSLFGAALAPTKMTVSLVTQLAAIFPEKNIGIWIQQTKKEELGIMVRVSDINEPFPRRSDALSGHAERYVIFRLDFMVKNNILELIWLQSATNRRGRGGKALALLHNLGQKLGLGQIIFSVDRYNQAAKDFYRHMKFGEPQDKAETLWIEELKK